MLIMNDSTTNIDLRDEDEIEDKRKKKSKKANAKCGKSPNNIVLKDDESEVKQYIILQSVHTKYIHTYTSIKYIHVCTSILRTMLTYITSINAYVHIQIQSY